MTSCWPREFANYREAAKVIAEASADYNGHRIHSAIGCMTPAEFPATVWRGRINEGRNRSDIGARNDTKTEVHSKSDERL